MKDEPSATSMDHGLWTMDYGLWTTVYGLWIVINLVFDRTSNSCCTPAVITPQFQQIQPAIKLLVDIASRCVEDESYGAVQFALIAARGSALTLLADAAIMLPREAPRPTEDEASE